MVGILKRAARRLYRRLPWSTRCARAYRYLYRVFLGNDIFLSYGRRDASLYAEALGRQLTRAGLICYSDRRDPQPGRNIPRSVLWQLTNSSVLVVLGSCRAALSSSVRHEVEFFSKTSRPIVPVDFGGALSRAKWFHLIQGAEPERELLTALAKGFHPTPSPLVLQRIIQVEETVSRRRSLREISLFSLLGIVALLLTAAWVASSLVARANDQRLVAELAEDRAITSAWRAQLAEWKADSDRVTAETAAKTAADEARRQQNISDALQLADEAEGLRADFPNLLESSAQKAGEAVRRFQALGLTNASADRTLRRAVELLRPRVAELPYLFHLNSFALSADGRFIAIAADRVTAVQDLDPSGAAVRLLLPEKCCEDMAFTTDTRLAVVDGEHSLHLCSIWGGAGPKCDLVANGLSTVAFSQAGDTLVSLEQGANGTSANIWKLTPQPSGPIPIRLPGRIDSVVALGLSENGSYLAVGAYTKGKRGQEVFLIDCRGKTPTPPQTFDVPELSPNASPMISGVGVSEEGGVLIAAVNFFHGAGVPYVIAWDLRTRAEMARLPMGLGTTALAVFPGGRSFAISDIEGGVHISDLTTRNDVARLVPTSRGEPVRRLALSWNRHRLAAASPRQGLVVWDLEPGLGESAWAPAGLFSDPILSPDGRLLARNDGKDEVIIDDLQSRSSQIVKGRFGGAAGGRLLFRGNHLVVEGYQAPMAVLRVTPEKSTQIQLPSSADDVTFTTDATRMAIRTFGKVGVYTTRSPFAGVEIPDSSGSLDAAIHPEGSYVAVASRDSVTLWALPNGTSVRSPHRVDSVPTGIADTEALRWSPKGDFLAIRGPEKTYLWATRRLKVVNTLAGKVTDFGFSPNGRFFAAANPDRTLTILEKPFSTPGRPSHLVQPPLKIAFHPESSFVAVALSDRTTDILNLQTGKSFALLGSAQSVRDLAFSRDGHYLVTLDQSRTVRHELWRPEDLLREATARTRRGKLYPVPGDLARDAAAEPQ